MATGRASASKWRANEPSRDASLGAVESRDHVLRDRLRLHLAGIAGIATDPHTCLEGLDCQSIALREQMLHAEARALELGDLGLDHDVVAEPCGADEARPRVDHWIAGKIIGFEKMDFGRAQGALEERR